MASEADLQISPAAALRPVAWLIAAVEVLRTTADPDLWGHVQFGQDMLTTWTLPRIDPYSFTQDRPWINHEWLSELQMGIAYRIGGAPGLMLLKGMVVAASIAIVWRSLARVSPAWRWGGAIFATAALFPLVTTLRPQLWTVLLLAILCRLLTANDRRVWAIPIIFVLWANLHGGWVVGLAVLAAWTAAHSIQHGFNRRLVMVSVASVIGTLVTPYGVELWTFVASTVRLERADITEWQPVWSSAANSLYWLCGPALVAISWRRHGRPSFPTLVVLLMLSVASVRVVRLVPLFLFATVMLIEQRFPRGPAPAAPRAQVAVELAVCAAAVLLAVQTRGIPTCISMAYRPPDPIAFAALIEARPSGRLVTFFDWGEAALERLGPELKVSVDGRRETVYTDATLREQTEIRTGTATGLAALARLAPDYVWLPLPSSARTYAWLKENGYRIDVDTGKSFVAVRPELPVVARSSGQPVMCFPFTIRP